MATNTLLRRSASIHTRTITACIVLAMVPAISNCSTSPIQPTSTPIVTSTVVPSSTTELTTLPSVVVTTTPDSDAQRSMAYTSAIAAMNNGEWEQATRLLRNIYAEQPGYLNTDTLLSQAYVNWGQEILTAERLPEALDKLNTALVFEPLNKQALNLQQPLAQYLSIIQNCERKQWERCIVDLEQLRTSTPQGYLDSNQLLYTAYLAYADQLIQSGQRTAALKQLRLAAQIPDIDISKARATITELEDQASQPSPPPPTTLQSAPTSVAPTYRWVAQIVQQPTDDAAQCGVGFESVIWGSVRNVSGKPIANAIVRVQSSDSRHTFDVKTNNQGGYKVPGLGCTRWRVSVLSTPGFSNLKPVSVIVTKINGGRYTSAQVDFRLIEV